MRLLLGILPFLFCVLYSENKKNYGEASSVYTAETRNVQKRCERLVQRAVSFFESHELDESCAQFQNNSRWLQGGLFVVVIDYEHGIILTFGPEKEKIGQDRNTKKKGIQSLLTKQPFSELQKSAENASWTTFALNYSYMRMFVKVAHNKGKKFIIGAGYYPQSDASRCVDMIKQAIATFQSEGTDLTLELISDPEGVFVNGGIYIWVIDQNGLVRAHGHDRSMIGRNFFDPTLGLNASTIEQLKNFLNSPDKEAWIKYSWEKLEKYSYTKKYFDEKTQMTFVLGTGFYVNISDKSIVDLVHQAKHFIRLNDIETASLEFAKANSIWQQGDRGVFVYTLDGLCLINTLRPDLVNKNQYDRVDSYGRPYVKQLITQTLKLGKAWVTHEEKEAIRAQYTELLVFPNGETLIVGSGHWVTSKMQLIRDMVERASEFMTLHGPDKAARKFSHQNSEFLYGDISITLLDKYGVCRAFGPFRKDLVWGFLKHYDFLHTKPGFVKVRGKGSGYEAYVKHTMVSNEEFTLIAGFFSH